MCDSSNGLEVGDIVAGISDTLNVDRLCLVINGSTNVLGLVAIHKLGRDAEAREQDLELVVCAAVEVGCRDNVVASVREGGDGQELGCLARGCSNSGDTSLQGCDPLLEYIDCGAARVVSIPASIWSLRGRTHFMIRE